MMKLSIYLSAILFLVGCEVSLKAPEPLDVEGPSVPPQGNQGTPNVPGDDVPPTNEPARPNALPVSCEAGDTTRVNADTEGLPPSPLLEICGVLGAANHHLYTATVAETVLAEVRFTDLNVYVVPKDGYASAADCPTPTKVQSFTLEPQAQYYIVVSGPETANNTDYRLDLSCDP